MAPNGRSHDHALVDPVIMDNSKGVEYAVTKHSATLRCAEKMLWDFFNVLPAITRGVVTPFSSFRHGADVPMDQFDLSIPETEALPEYRGAMADENGYKESWCSSQVKMTSN